MRQLQPAGCAVARVYGGERALVLGLADDGAVAGQVVRPVDVLDAQRLADEHGAKAGAVDEEVAADISVPFASFTALDESVLALRGFDHACLRCGCTPRASAYLRRYLVTSNASTCSA